MYFRNNYNQHLIYGQPNILVVYIISQPELVD